MTTAVDTIEGRTQTPYIGLWLPRLLWGGWLVVVVISLTVAGVAFSRYIADPGDAPLLQGPLAVNPTIQDQLETLLATDALAALQIGVQVAGFLLFAVTAVFLVRRRPSSWVPLIGSAMLMSVGASLFAPLQLLRDDETWAAWARLVGFLSPAELAGYWASLAGLMLVAFFLIFPSGKWVPAGSGWVLLPMAVFVGGTAFAPDSILSPAVWPSGIQSAWIVGVPAAIVAAQVYRMVAASTAVQRLQARPVVISLVVAIGSFLIIWVLKPELSEGVFGLILTTPRLRAIYDLNLLILLTAAVFLFPVSIWFAVARYRLFDLELLTNRALVYGTLSVMVAVGFIGLALVVVLFAGGGLADAIEGPPAAIAGIVMGVAVVVGFQPLRRRVQIGIDRRLYREKYDAERTVDAFAARANDELDLTLLSEDVCDVVDQTLQPERRLLWLAAGGGQEIGISREAQSRLLAAEETIDLAQSEEVWALVEFGSAGWVVAAPLISQRELVGALFLGPRRGEQHYSSLDLDLIDRLVNRAAPALRMAHLVGRQEEEALQRERVDRELDVARRIQLDLLPKQLPDIAGWEISVHYQPARQVGGDLYDFIDFEDGRWGVIVGDVTDKGVPAAMVMATCRTLLRGAAGRGERSPGQILARVNDLLHPDIPEAMFVTCLFGVLDPARGKFLFANAGHNLPYVDRGAEVVEVRATGMPLGLMAGMEYEEVETELGVGDTIMLSSDGLVEAHSPDGEMLGFERVLQAMGYAPDNATLIEHLLAVQSAFTGPDWEQEDDITLLTLQRTR